MKQCDHGRPDQSHCFISQKYNNHLKISYNSHTRLEYCLQIHSIYWRGITKIELFANGYSRYCPLSIIHKFWGGGIVSGRVFLTGDVFLRHAICLLLTKIHNEATTPRPTGQWCQQSSCRGSILALDHNKDKAVA